jgi:hypothetical protein
VPDPFLTLAMCASCKSAFATVARSDSTRNLINLFSASVNNSYRYPCIFLFVDLASVGNAAA